MEKQSSNELKNSTYELFIGALSILSLINLIIYFVSSDSTLIGVVAGIDTILSIVFLVDFLYRFFSANSKTDYFIRQFGWADLLASLPLPQMKILRLFRIVRAGRLMRQYGPVNMVRNLVENRADSALLTLLFLIVLILEFGGLAIIYFERASPEANITSAADALWYTYVTITTVGYGDTYPVTFEGRVVGFFIMTAGVGLFGTLTGYLANLFLAPPKKKREAESPDKADPKTKLAELKRLLVEQKQAQALLEAKIGELESLL